MGRYTYTSDQRFEAMHSPHTEEWTLRIRNAQKRDTGIYECQISTTPPIGQPVYLSVVGTFSFLKKKNRRILVFSQAKYNNNQDKDKKTEREICDSILWDFKWIECSSCVLSCI